MVAQQEAEPISPEPDSPDAGDDAAARVRWWLFGAMQAVMAVGIAWSLYEGRWLTAVATGLIIGVMFLPTLLHRRFRLDIPDEYESLAVAFVFASVFLGEVRGYYHRFWWWDIALHTVSGLLLGIFGFLLVYVLNANSRVHLSMRPGFVALFAFLFAVAIGAIWEIFEFTADQLLGLDMQKAMFGDPSGLTDTMWDLIVDTLGAAAISGLGWWHLRRDSPSFIDAWIRKFVRLNPHLFRSPANMPARKNGD